MSISASSPVFADIDLPGTRLHYVQAGSGSPLIILPATVSLISQWQAMVQFMGRKYTATFFELPGHGGSTPYPVPFNSRMIPGTVEALADAFGYDRFSLMGFSFGGLLTLRTLEVLEHRIDRLILISPVISHRALKFTNTQLFGLKFFCFLLSKPASQAFFHSLLGTPVLEKFFTWLVHTFGKVPEAVLRSKNALHIPRSTLDVLAHTMQEILTMEYQPPQGPFALPCYYGMSLYDDMVDYRLTTQLVQRMFTNLIHQQYYLPYHQPPEPPTLAWLDHEFGSFLDLLPED